MTKEELAKLEAQGLVLNEESARTESENPYDGSSAHVRSSSNGELLDIAREQLNHLRSIKSMMIFFTVLLIIGLLAGLVAGAALWSNIAGLLGL
ncbi:MAG: hypothetical protein LBR76_02535 [Oscillospiraceae bacterium]|jgi:hypothetical protein|nr:hypothetical protein [Oscillospiraceae bacterium]